MIRYVMNIFECLSSYITSFHAYEQNTLRLCSNRICVRFVWNLTVCPLVNSSQKSMKFSNDFEELFEVSAGFGVSFVFFPSMSRFDIDPTARFAPFCFHVICIRTCQE